MANNRSGLPDELARRLAGVDSPKSLSLAILPWTVTILSLAVIVNSIVTYRSIYSIYLLREEVSSTNEVLRTQMRVEMIFKDDSKETIFDGKSKETGT